MADLRVPDDRLSVSLQATQLLRDAIIRGELPAGTRLLQNDLAHKLGVSAAPVREALRNLESEGLVAYLPHRGCHVLGLSDSELVNVILPIRAILEEEAVTAYLARTDRDDEMLRRHLDAMAEAAHEGLTGVVLADGAFHEELMVQSGLPHSLQLWRVIQSRMLAQFHRMGRKYEAPEAIVREHEALFKVITTQPSQVARQAIRAHVLDDNFAILGVERAPSPE